MGRWAALPERGRVAWRTPWVRTLIILWIAQVISEFAFSFALPFVPLYLQDLGVSDPNRAGLWAGAMSGGFALVMGIMAPIWGIVADRYGRRMMIQRALFGAAVVVGAMAFVMSAEQLFILRLLQGSVTGLVAAISTVVSLVVPRARLAMALGLVQTALFTGGALGPLVGGVVSDLVGFRAAFGLTGVLFLIGAILVTLCVAEPPREPLTTAQATATARDGGWHAFIRQREILAVLGMFIIIRFANFAPNPILPLYVQSLLPDGQRLATLAGLVVAATGVASTISALLIGTISDRFGRRLTLLVCMLAAAITCLPQAFVGTVWQLLLLRIATGLALGGMLPIVQAIFTELTPPDRRGMGFGILAAAGSIGLGGGPLTGSLVAARFGIPAVFLVMTPFFLLGAWSLLQLPKQKTQAVAIPAQT
jgi:DHA1 family multidrug resistance protein-like MFS transporter